MEKDELLQQSLAQFVTWEDRDKFYLHCQRAYEHRQPRASEVQMVKQSGERMDVRIESRLDQGQASQLWVMVIEMTKERQLQHRLVAQREELRQKIARDLHDGPIQALAAINFALRGILLDHPGREITKSIEAIQASVREQIQDLRSYIVDLRPPMLDQLGLEKSLYSYMESFREKYPDLAVQMKIQPIDAKLSEVQSVALYRIFQEALMNISKHAGTKNIQVNITLKNEGPQVRLEIQDNGEGFILPDQWLDFAQAGHLGILGMRERVEMVGGHLDIQSAKGKGTRVIAVIPMRNGKPIKG